MPRVRVARQGETDYGPLQAIIPMSGTPPLDARAHERHAGMFQDHAPVPSGTAGFETVRFEVHDEVLSSKCATASRFFAGGEIHSVLKTFCFRPAPMYRLTRMEPQRWHQSTKRFMT